MQTLREEIHTGRVLYYSSRQNSANTVIATSEKRVAQVTSSKPQAGLEEELWAYYVAENSPESRKKIMGFLGNPDKIRDVAEFTLREVQNGYNGQANTGDRTVREINKLINEELARRSKQGNVLMKG